MSRWFRHYAGMMRDDKLVGAAIRAKQPVERVVWVWADVVLRYRPKPQSKPAKKRQRRARKVQRDNQNP